MPALTGDVTTSAGAVATTIVDKGIRCRVYNNANLSIPNNTVTVLTFNSERYDTDTMHSTSSNTDRLTATRAGLYSIVGNVEFASAAGTLRTLFIYLNGATLLASTLAVPVSGNVTRLTITTQYELGAGDYVTFAVYQDSGGALNVQAASNYSPEFMMARIL